MVIPHPHFKLSCFSEACSIQLDDIVIITGGSGSESRVQVYNLSGSVSRLQDLLTGRWNHACGHYVHQEKIVRNQ